MAHPYLTDPDVLVKTPYYINPDVVAAVNKTFHRNMGRFYSNGCKGSWEGRVFQPRDQPYLKKISQTTSWMLRHDQHSLDQLQGGYLPMDYILSHSSMVKREACR